MVDSGDPSPDLLLALERHASGLAVHQTALLELVRFQEALFEHSLLPTDLLSRLAVLSSRLWRQGQELEASSAATAEAAVVAQEHARKRAAQLVAAREAQQSAPACPAFKAHEVDRWLATATTAKKVAAPPAAPTAAVHVPAAVIHAPAAVVHEEDEGEVARLRTALIAERWKNMQSRIRWSAQQTHMTEEATALRQHIKLVTIMYQKLWDARGVGSSGATNNAARPATVPSKPSPWSNSEAATGAAQQPGRAVPPRRASTARGTRTTARVPVTAAKARCGSAQPSAPSWAVVQQPPPPPEAPAAAATATATSGASGGPTRASAGPPTAVKAAPKRPPEEAPRQQPQPQRSQPQPKPPQPQPQPQPQQQQQQQGQVAPAGRAFSPVTGASAPPPPPPPDEDPREAATAEPLEADEPPMAAEEVEEEEEAPMGARRRLPWEPRAEAAALPPTDEGAGYVTSAAPQRRRVPLHPPTPALPAGLRGAVAQHGGTAGLGGAGNAADVLRSLADDSGGDGDAARQETLGEHALALSLAHAQQLDFVQRTYEQRIKELRLALDAATPRSRLAAAASPRAGTAPPARGALPSVTQQLTWEEARAAIATTARRHYGGGGGGGGGSAASTPDSYTAGSEALDEYPLDEYYSHASSTSCNGSDASRGARAPTYRQARQPAPPQGRALAAHGFMSQQSPRVAAAAAARRQSFR